MYTGSDVEGHLGDDGRFYLIDLSRTFPPVRPIKDVPGSFLFQLFRPQFVRNYPLALCSDAYSQFTRGTPLNDEHKEEVNAATEYLLSSVIPKFARDLKADLADVVRLGGSLEQFRLTEALHAAGINVRYLGLVALVMDEDSYQQTFVLAEIFSRLIKNDIRARMRTQMGLSQLPLDEPFISVLTNVLNLTFGTSSESANYWQGYLSPNLVSDFYIPPKKASRDWKAILFARNTEPPLDRRLLMLGRVLSMLGAELDHSLLDFLRENPAAFDTALIFDDTDVVDIGQRVKSLDIVSSLRASEHQSKAQMKEAAGNVAGAKRLYAQTLELLQMALNSSPTDGTLLRNICGLLLKLFQMDPQNKVLLSQAEGYCQKLLQIQPASAENLYIMGVIKERQGDMDEAEEFLLQSLLKDPQNLRALTEYSRLLRQLKAPQAAAFEERLQEILTQAPPLLTIQTLGKVDRKRI